MPILSYWILLLVTMVLVLAVAGRHLPAPPVTPSLTPTPQVELTMQELEMGRASWKLPGHRSQDLDSIGPSPRPHRKIFRGKGAKEDSIYGRSRLLVGSAPPSCQGKCGACIPCTPIHTPVGSSPPGSLTQQEYYPEVWRCQCGNKLFLP